MCVCVGVALSAVDMFFAGAKTLLTSQRGETLMEIKEEMGKETVLKLSTEMGNNKMLLQLKLSNDSGGKVAGERRETRELRTPSTDKHKAETMRKIVRH